MAIEIAHHKEVYEGRKDGGEEEVGSVHVEEEPIGATQTLRKESDEELFSEMMMILT